MQSDRRYWPGQVWLSSENQLGANGTYDVSIQSPVDVDFASGSRLPTYADAAAFKPPEVCTNRLMMFGQGNFCDPVMPSAHDLNYPGYGFHVASIGEESRRNTGNEGAASSTFEEDMEGIDALLSLDADEPEDSDDEVSTARTYGYDESSSPESCSNRVKPRKVKSSSSRHYRSFDGSLSSEGKRLRLKKMVKTMRGIVPGGEQMNTVSVLDEAVKYLQSLKVEAQELGVRNLS